MIRTFRAETHNYTSENLRLNRKLEPIRKYGAFDSPLRNIRLVLMGGDARFDLIPEAILDTPSDLSDEKDPAIRRVLEGTRLVVEADRFLRIHFDIIVALAGGTDEDVDLFGGLHQDWHDAPPIKGS